MDELEREKTSRLLDWSRGQPRGPFKIDIEIHRRCNLRCLSCSRRADEKYSYINEFSRTIEMPVERWLAIADEAAALGVREWHVAGGGDPPYLPEVTFPMLERIKKHGMYGILTTNGTNLSARRIEQIVEMGWDRIHFSVDGPDAATHDYLRQIPGAFDKTIGAIRALGRLRRKRRSETPMLNMNTVLSRPNFRRLPDFVRLARSLDMAYMFVEPLIIYSPVGESIKLTEQDRREFAPHLEEAIRLARKWGIDSNFAAIQGNLQEELIEKSSAMHEVVEEDMRGHEPDSFLSIPCYDPWFHMTVKADGRVISCDVATDEGDSIRERSLRDIWYGPYFERHRTGLRSKEIPSYCAQCNPSHTTQRRWLREVIKEMGDEV